MSNLLKVELLEPLDLLRAAAGFGATPAVRFEFAMTAARNTLGEGSAK